MILRHFGQKNIREQLSNKFIVQTLGFTIYNNMTSSNNQDGHPTSLEVLTAPLFKVKNN